MLYYCELKETLFLTYMYITVTKQLQEHRSLCSAFATALVLVDLIKVISGSRMCNHGLTMCIT